MKPSEPVRSAPGPVSRLLFTIVLGAMMGVSVGGVLYALNNVRDGGEGGFTHKIAGDSLHS